MRVSSTFTMILSYMILLLFFSKFLGVIGWIINHFFLFIVAILWKRLTKIDLLMVICILTVIQTSTIFLSYDTLHTISYSLLYSFTNGYFPEWLFTLFILLSPISFFLSCVLSLGMNLLLVRIFKLRRRVGGAIH